MKDKKIGVLMGGVSAERAISLKTGEAILCALKRLGYQAVEIDVDSKICIRLLEEHIEVAFIALHGRYGEDGTIQGLLEIMGIPYTGSGVTASALAMNKIISKRLFHSQGIPTPPWRTFPVNEYVDVELEMSSILQPFEQETAIGWFDRAMGLKVKTDKALTVLEGSRNEELLAGDFPVVVKPSSEGSTIGVKVVYDENELREAIDEVQTYSPNILIERFIDGSEITVGILEGEVLPTIEIVPRNGFYDYNSKYTAGMTEYLIPTSLEEETDKSVQQLAIKAYKVLGCRGTARVDMIVDRDRIPWILEVNTIPGMTETSLIPRSAQSIGISFDKLVEKILLGARLGD